MCAHRNLEEDESRRASLEYTVQLVLSSLLNICNYLQAQGNAKGGLLLGFFSVGYAVIPPPLIVLSELLPETQFNVELVVQCVRVSNNPQTHNHALLLLGSAATVFPVSVCVHV